MLLEGSLAGDAQLPCDLRPRPSQRTRGTHLRPLQLICQLPQGGNGAQSRPGIPVPCGGGQGDGLVFHTVNLGWQSPLVNLSWQERARRCAGSSSTAWSNSVPKRHGGVEYSLTDLGRTQLER
jgi:hypothetical protein